VPPQFSGCPQGGAIVSILVGDEHLYGTAHIGATQDISGTGALDVLVCGIAGGSDQWRLEVRAQSLVSADAAAPQPLPLTASDEIDVPSSNVTARVQSYLHGTSAQGLVTSAQIIASAGSIRGTAVAGDAGTVTFDGAYDFSCSTNEPDPNFLTTFCKQFEALAPP
jgi:hypothetical protein